MPKVRGKRSNLRFRGRSRPLSERQKELRRQLEVIDNRIQMDILAAEIRKLKARR